MTVDTEADRSERRLGPRHRLVREGRGGEPLVLLHGPSESAQVWRRSVGPLAAAGFDVVAPELRTSGAHRDTRTRIAELHALLRNDVGFARATLVGSGSGGAIACDFALRFPGTTGLLVLVDAPLPREVVPTEALLLVRADAEPLAAAEYESAAERLFPNRIGPLGVRAADPLVMEAAEAVTGAIRHLCRAAAPRPDDAVAYVALGSNLGNRERHLCAAFAALRALPGVARVDASRVYETDPVGPGEQGCYLNAAARVVTRIPPHGLLERMLAIERAEGRCRTGVRNEPRTLDLDLLLYDEEQLVLPDLVVPHPRIAERAFVLEPLRDLAPDLVLPGGTATIAELASAVRDRDAVRVRES
jgi:2-amino-4-hydroxy-6-hydroxymethyldihydropteridine diphosphokinase